MENSTNFPLPPLTLPEKGKEEFRFLLGHDDAEMREIEAILTSHKMKFRHATCGGKRVHPGNAYRADPVTIEKGTTLVLVECEPTNFRAFTGKIRIVDHHREGDPGFGLAPSLFWEASSLGQVCKLLGVRKKSIRLKVKAARDHCRFRMEECPGVDPRIATNLGRVWMSIELGVHRSELEECIQRTAFELKRSPVILMGSQMVVDFTKIPVSEIYSLGYFGVFEALADIGRAAIVQTRNVVGDREKIVLLGKADKSTVRHFKEVWAPARGLEDIYGCEVRGHAGGYYTDNSVVVA